MVHLVFSELLPFDEICTGHYRLILSNKDQFLGQELLRGGKEGVHHF